MKKQSDFFKLMAEEHKKRNNPSDLKAGIIGVVKSLNPVVVATNEGSILLTEGDNLEISEWFRKRCEIDKTTNLSIGVVSDLASALAVNEIHSGSGLPCNMPSAIEFLANAIEKINTELLAQKCVLVVGDYVSLASLEQDGKYSLLDKVLMDEGIL